ncbi:MAG: hypothetical protein ABS939_15290 [Psychrobacillus sp.]
MNEIKRLEMLSGSIRNEIDELQSMLENSDNTLLKAKRLSFQKQLRDIISNLSSANDAVYGVFEGLNSNDIENLENDYNILYDILGEKLSYDEKMSIKFKYGIEFDY